MANSICSNVVGRGSIVLMARIVGGAGVAIRSLDVLTIEYSVYEVDPFWPEQLTVMRGHCAEPLSARDVLFDSPQVGDGWDLDDVGYNFRHEIKLMQGHPFANWKHSYEAVYQLTLCNGRRADIRFKIRRSMQGLPPPRSLREWLPHCARATLSRPCSFGPSPQGGGSMTAHIASSIRSQQ
jgi:hypothetical protein